MQQRRRAGNPTRFPENGDDHGDHGTVQERNAVVSGTNEVEEGQSEVEFVVKPQTLDNAENVPGEGRGRGLVEEEGEDFLEAVGIEGRVD